MWHPFEKGDCRPNYSTRNSSVVFSLIRTIVDLQNKKILRWIDGFGITVYEISLSIDD